MNGKWNMENGTSRLSTWLANGLLGTLMLAGCSSQPTEVADYKPQVVMTGYLFNGEPLAEVFLERVAPFAPSYDPRNYGIANAHVRVFGGGDTVTLVDDPAYHGRYVPPTGVYFIPRSKTHYRIEATTPESEALWAETIVPDTLSQVNIYLSPDYGIHRLPVREGDTLNRDDPNMFWEWSPVDSAGGYVGVILALTPADSLVPLDPNYDPTKDSIKVEERRRARYTVTRADQHIFTISWLWFRWQGPQRIELQAVSPDYYEYMFTMQRVEQGVLDKPSTNINGGLGIFSGISRKAIQIVMKKT